MPTVLDQPSMATGADDQSKCHNDQTVESSTSEDILIENGSPEKSSKLIDRSDQMEETMVEGSKEQGEKRDEDGSAKALEFTHDALISSPHNGFHKEAAADEELTVESQFDFEVDMHHGIFETPLATTVSDVESFASASSMRFAELNDSVEPMDIDIPPEDIPAAFDRLDSTSTASMLCPNLESNEVAVTKDMSAEESAIAPAAAAQSTSNDAPSEEKPVCGKGSYAIDWDNFDENAMNPFGTRATSGGKAKGAGGVKRTPKKSAKAQGLEEPVPVATTTADNNANEISAIESAKVQEPSRATAADLKNSNINSGEGMDAVISNNNDIDYKESTIRANKPIRQSSQQTAVVAPTVHVATALESGQPDTAPISNRTSSRPTAKATVSVQQTIVVAGHQRDQQLSSGRVKGGEDSMSEEETFSMASSDPFNNTAAFDYLQKAGQNAPGSRGSNLHRQSLFTNFDPLVGGGDSPSVGNCRPTRQRSPNDGAIATGAAVSLSDVTLTEDDLMNLNTTPVSNQSHTEGGPSPQATVVKKKHPPGTQPLANGSFGNGDNAGLEPQALPSSGLEVKSQFQALLLAKEKEFQLRLQEENDKRVRAEKELNVAQKDAEAAKLSAAEMSFVVAEYEKTVRQLISDKDKPKQTRMSGEFENVSKERDQALEDLQTVENAFSELNRRYETLRNSTVEFKKNEEALKSNLTDYQHKLKKLEEKYSKLYSHAELKLDLANQEIEKLQKARESDTLSLRASLKKKELQVETLEKNLEQKQKEIQELSAICDELILKAGGQ